MEGEYFWVNLREDKKMSESKIAVSQSNMVEFKMAAIIKLSQNEWVKVFFCANRGNQSWQVWVSLRGKLRWLNPRWPNSRWQNSRWLPSSSWVRMNEFESDWISLTQSFVQNGWIQDGGIQDGCHHQVESEWMSKVFFVQMVGREVGVKSFLCKWWEPILASVSEFERKN